MFAAKVEERMLPVKVGLPVAGLVWCPPCGLRCHRLPLRLAGRWRLAGGTDELKELKVVKALFVILPLPLLMPRLAESC